MKSLSNNAIQTKSLKSKWILSIPLQFIRWHYIELRLETEANLSLEQFCDFWCWKFFLLFLALLEDILFYDQFYFMLLQFDSYLASIIGCVIYSLLEQFFI